MSNNLKNGALEAVIGVANFYGIGVDLSNLHSELGNMVQNVGAVEIIKSLRFVGLQSKSIQVKSLERLKKIPVPAILKMNDGHFIIYTGFYDDKFMRYIDPLTRKGYNVNTEEFFKDITSDCILIRKRFNVFKDDDQFFNFNWFIPFLYRYRASLINVLLASVFVQFFALVSPLFFQVVIDKVLSHQSISTLYSVFIGLIIISFFDVVLQYLRSFELSHTSNRIDVELGQRLFKHLLSLNISYFENRSAGQTVARVRELEAIRTFLTGQGLFSIIDVFFSFIFIAVLFFYSYKLTILVLLSFPCYFFVAFFIGPILQERIAKKFNAGAHSQQYLVESIVGILTIKSLAVEPNTASEWEERLASYVASSFNVNRMGLLGQNLILYINKLFAALLLFFGAYSVLEGDLTVGELIAFNMISSQLVQPILRLSQLWQDFQQVKTSVDRLGDILNAPKEQSSPSNVLLPVPKGLIEFKNVFFAYSVESKPVLKNINIQIKPGQVVGFVGASGSGKSTIAKLIQRLYLPTQGQIFIDNNDISNVNPSWVRRNIGVVLQENLLFNRSIHDNISLANPTLSRQNVIELAILSGAHEFIIKMPNGYDTIVEERGVNLSGGQRQRIAIARALSTNPPIIIFDEATSALDYESERIIQDNMSRIVKNRTVIIIAHRLAAVRNCDIIYGVRDGEIVEFGSHDYLLKFEHGIYSTLWNLQNFRNN